VVIVCLRQPDRQVSAKQQMLKLYEAAKMAEAEGKEQLACDHLKSLLSIAGNYDPDDDSVRDMIHDADSKLAAISKVRARRPDAERAELARMDAERSPLSPASRTKLISTTIGLISIACLIASLILSWQKEGERTRCPSCGERHALRQVGEDVLTEQFRPRTISTRTAFFGARSNHCAFYSEGQQQILVTIQDYIEIYSCRFCGQTVRSEQVRREFQE
jgi:hypothetical protein